MADANTEVIYKALGLRVRMIREAIGMPQADLGKAAGYTRTSINNIEAGRQRIQLHQVDSLSKALHTTPKHLLRGIWF